MVRGIARRAGEECFQHRFVTLAHLPQHPADGLVDEVLAVAQQPPAIRSVSAKSPRRMNASGDDRDAALPETRDPAIGEPARLRSTRYAPTMFGADSPRGPSC